MAIDRRSFIRHAASLGAGSLVAPSLGSLMWWSGMPAEVARTFRAGDRSSLGRLSPSADCPELHIPDGFRCVRVSRSREISAVNPALTVPNAMDGMAAFPLPNGDIRLIRNHEMINSARRAAPLGPRPYDPLASGGTSSLAVRVTGTGAARQLRLLEEFVSLGGTHVNCAGGRTPWGSWLSCEETTAGVSQGFEKPHGYIFEVPVSATQAVEAVPLKAMGRFVHEAIAVDERSGVVYETEDMRWTAGDETRYPGSGFFRFVPRTRGRLVDGGQLQVLVVRDRPRFNTVRNQTVGEKLAVSWVNIDNPDPTAAEADASAVFREGLSSGAAVFQRLEGCFWADDSCYFVSTEGGNAAAGQVWRFVPEGEGGSLSLVFESPSRDVLDAPDNICVGPRGGIFICEDGSDEEYIRVLSPTGAMANLVLQPVIDGGPAPYEFAGCCFSPDGSVLFFNVQGATTSYGTRGGTTYAMWGPWERAVAL